MSYIFIDGSYYCFHRYYALQQWWSNAYPDEPLLNPFENQIFVDKFRKTFIENIKLIAKKCKIPKHINPIIFCGKDCKRESIWRKELFPEYKANRIYDEQFMGGPFFKMAYEENLFQQGGVKQILSHPKLEADDCIALYVKWLLQKNPLAEIYIITSDRDYLQLNSHNVHLFNLAYKNIAENKSSTGNPIIDLQIKILMGDQSDNIPSSFPKCGPKTALKCIEDPIFFEKKIKDNMRQYELNKKLIDFNEIPQLLQDEFTQSVSLEDHL